MNQDFKLANSNWLGDIKEEDKQSILNEISQLNKQVNEYLSLQEYNSYMRDLYQNIDLEKTEAELLEFIVPDWVAHRSKEIPQDIQIDEFYEHLEMLILLNLIHEYSNNKELPEYKIKKMRDIIRRYSNMPSLWLFLCNISGQNISSTYSF